MDYAIASDIGATNLRVGLVSASGQLEQKQAFKTPQDDPNSTIMLLVNAISKLDIKNKSIAGIGIGVGGLVDFKEGVVVHTPNFKFSNIHLKDILYKKFKLPTFIDNDANASALGEKNYGAGKNIKNFVVLTLGSGIGGAIIINNELYRGHTGAAGEIGHMTINIGGSICGCGNDGDLEAVAGGRALDREAKERVKGRKDSLIFTLAKGDINKITGVLVTKAALQGDELANELLKKHAETLAIGLANIFNIFDPHLIILNGGLAEAGNLLLQPAKEILKNRIFADTKKEPSVIFGALGADAGLKGAAALVFEQLGK